MQSLADLVGPNPNSYQCQSCVHDTDADSDRLNLRQIQSNEHHGVVVREESPDFGRLLYAFQGCSRNLDLLSRCSLMQRHRAHNQCPARANVLTIVWYALLGLAALQHHSGVAENYRGSTLPQITTSRTGC